MSDSIDEFMTLFSDNPSLQETLKSDTDFHKVIREHPEFIAKIKELSPEERDKLIEPVLPILNVMLGERKKEKLIDSFHEDDKRLLASVITMMTTLTDSLIDKYSLSEDFKKVFTMLEEFIDGKIKITNLNEIFMLNKEKAKKVLSDRLTHLEKKFYGSQYENVKSIMLSSKPDKDNIVKKIFLKACKVKEHEASMIKGIDIDIYCICNDVIFCVDENLIHAKVDDDRHLERITLAICHPELMSFNYWISDDEYSSLPIRWFTKHLEVPIIIDLLNLYKTGEDISDFFAHKYKNGFQKIEEIISSPFMSPPFSRMVCCKKKAINETLACYTNENYYPAMCGLLALIEGSIWMFARYINDINQKPNKILKYAPHNQEIITHIINKNDGSRSTNITVGTLLQVSKMNEILDAEFIKYFCQEFYNERNDIMHGGNWGDATIVKTAQKLAVLEYILVESEKYIEKQIHMRYKTAFPESFLDELIVRLDNNQ